MIKLGMEDLEKVSGGSRGKEEFCKAVMCTDGFGADLIVPEDFYGNRGEAVALKRYREQGWVAMKRQEENFIKSQEKRNKRNYKKHLRIGQG